MENIFNPVYRQDYKEGYAAGQNPYLKIDNKQHSEAFNIGFNYGRVDYTRLNGNIITGIPQLIVTDLILEDFLLAGMLGLQIDAEGYTSYQMNIIERWYLSGIEKYDASQSNYLLTILERNGIEIAS